MPGHPVVAATMHDCICSCAWGIATMEKGSLIDLVADSQPGLSISIHPAGMIVRNHDGVPLPKR